MNKINRKENKVVACSTTIEKQVQRVTQGARLGTVTTAGKVNLHAHKQTVVWTSTNGKAATSR